MVWTVPIVMLMPMPSYAYAMAIACNCIHIPTHPRFVCSLQVSKFPIYRLHNGNGEAFLTHAHFRQSSYVQHLDFD